MKIAVKPTENNTVLETARGLLETEEAVGAAEEEKETQKKNAG